MNESSKKKTEHRGECRKGRIARLGIFALVLVGLGVVGTALIGPTWAGGGWKHHRSEIATVEDAREHARDIAAWVTGTVDGTEPQGEKIDAVLVNLAESLYPLAEQHREQRRVLLTEASRPDIDRESLEQIRGQALLMADQASAALVDAFVEISGVLEPEQRQTLMTLASKFKRYHH